MHPMAEPDPPLPPPPPGEQPGGSSGGRGDSTLGTGWPRWSLWVLLGVVGASIVLTSFLGDDGDQDISYDRFITLATEGRVTEIEFDNNTGDISGELTSGDSFDTTGPLQSGIPESDLETLRANDVDVRYNTPTESWFTALLPILIPFALLGLFFWWMQRRAQGQMSGIMSIGRSKAKTYSTERPGTTFADVAGYAGVKQEITEVVDFLKYPERFGEIGARIPKGVLLVGPPGTGKTLIARAVAGEAGVPFLSVTGSDFMEMFVGVGASRVRDLFDSARKMGRAIIFIDEIDSIGRKRGAGLGGGHDEREQTLNQMLSEMDGFEATEGIVMMAATNRPDILDSGAASTRPLRPSGHRAAARARRSGGHHRGPHRAQAAGRGRRPPGRGPGHPGHERRGHRQPRQRGGALRRRARARTRSACATSNRRATGS